MYRKLFLPAMLGVIVLTPACFLDDEDLLGCVNGDGPIISETLNIGEFEGIQLEMDAEVYITQGPDFDVTVEGKENIIDELERDIRSGIWRIETDDCVRDVDELRIYITLPRIRSIGISGSGSIRGENVFLVDDIDLTISGSGQLDLGLEADDIDVRISGSGDLELEGLADELDARISGSGDINAFRLRVREADVQISGSGDTEITVTDYLRARISGSGDILYKGNPALDVSVSGSGEVRDVN